MKSFLKFRLLSTFTDLLDIFDGFSYIFFGVLEIPISFFLIADVLGVFLVLFTGERDCLVGYFWVLLAPLMKFLLFYFWCSAALCRFCFAVWFKFDLDGLLDSLLSILNVLGTSFTLLLEIGVIWVCMSWVTRYIMMVYIFFGSLFSSTNLVTFSVRLSPLLISKLFF